MPTALSYPGLYIQESTSGVRSIVAAPTSIAVFVGYTHPFKTANPGVPVSIFSFAEYERHFGGLYESGVLDSAVPLAVRQFFLNGGSDAYVVGLKPSYQTLAGGVAGTQPVTAAQATFATDGGGGIVFTAREPTDAPNLAMSIQIVVPEAVAPANALDRADIVIAYGRRVETYRGVTLDEAGLETINAASSLIQVEAAAGGFGTEFQAAGSFPLSLTTTLPSDLVGTFAAADFAEVFRSEGPLDKVPVFNLLLAPGVTDNGVLSGLLAFAERKLAFAILDAPANAGADANDPPDMESVFASGVIPQSQNGAIYFPWLKSSHPLSGAEIELPPSGFVAGIYARTDARRGVLKAPAGLETIVNNTTGVVDRGRMTDERHGKLNLAGVNVLRSFSDGTVVFGARTLVSANPAFQQYRYIPVRRMTLFIEQTILANLKWIVFEPNDEPLWLAIRATLENFLLSLHSQGALQGKIPSEAFEVVCDRSTTTQDDIDQGIVNVSVAFAPLKPAEFVRITISHLAGQARA